MASSRASPTPYTFVSGLHLIFTLTSVAFLSYKVYYLENELSLIRGVIHSQEPSDVGITASQVTPLSTVPTKEQIISERNRRAQSSSADKLKAKCARNFLNDLQVCLIHFLVLISLIINTQLWIPPSPPPPPPPRKLKLYRTLYRTEQKKVNYDYLGGYLNLILLWGQSWFGLAFLCLSMFKISFSQFKL